MTRLDYCQFVLSTPLNYTMTYFAKHSEAFGHAVINRYMAGDRITPRMLWENVRDDLVTDEEAIVIFDDVALDKEHAEKIELVRRQWSGSAKAVIKGIGVVTFVYVNPKTDQSGSSITASLRPTWTTRASWTICRRCFRTW
jgi:hypothetical protein